MQFSGRVLRDNKVRAKKKLKKDLLMVRVACFMIMTGFSKNPSHFCRHFEFDVVFTG